MKFSNLSPILLAATLLACSTKDVAETKDKAQNLADSVRDNIPSSLQDLETTKFVAQTLEKVDIKAGIRAIHNQDLAKVTAFCSRLDKAFGTTIFTTYSKACESDLHKSTDLAIKFLESENANGDLPPIDKAALEAARDAALKAKGLFNRETFAILLIIYLDSKYPHGKWTVFLAPILAIDSVIADEATE